MNDEEKRKRINELMSYYISTENPIDIITGDVDDGSTLLHFAAYTGNMEATKLLVELNADVNALNEDHWTPLHDTTVHGNFDIYDYLVSHGALENIENNVGCTPKQLRENYVIKHDECFSEFSRILATHGKLSADKISPEMRVVEDLRINGDNAEELLMDIADKFQASFKDFCFAAYFADENSADFHYSDLSAGVKSNSIFVKIFSCLRMPYWKLRSSGKIYKTLTVRHLFEMIEQGQLNNFYVLGFDMRVIKNIDGRLVSEHVIRDDIKLGISADPKIFPTVEQTPSKRQQADIYQRRNSIGLLTDYSRKISLKRLEYYIAITADKQTYDTLLEGETQPLNESKLQRESDFVYEGWRPLGYDIVQFNDISSALFSGAPINEALKTDFKPYINNYGLFKDYAAAVNFAACISTQIPANAPFSMVTLWARNKFFEVRL